MQNKILIVEDDTDLSTMYKIKFEKEWYEVKVADNWLTAVTLVTEFKPNAILLDIMMPSMDWFETLRVIRDLAPSLNTKIIMFSNLNSKDDIDKCMKLWADAYLLKASTTPKDAVEKVKSMIWNTSNPVENNSQNKIIKECPHCHKNIEIDINFK
jgi:DNA-binding response OmpR family regulator